MICQNELKKEILASYFYIRYLNISRLKSVSDQKKFVIQDADSSIVTFAWRTAKTAQLRNRMIIRMKARDSKY